MEEESTVFLWERRVLGINYNLCWAILGYSEMLLIYFNVSLLVFLVFRKSSWASLTWSWKMAREILKGVFVCLFVLPNNIGGVCSWNELRPAVLYNLRELQNSFLKLQVKASTWFLEYSEWALSNWTLCSDKTILYLSNRVATNHMCTWITCVLEMWLMQYRLSFEFFIVLKFGNLN